MAGSPFWDGYNNGFAAVQQIRQQGALRKYNRDPNAGLDDLRVVDPQLAGQMQTQRQQGQVFQQQQDDRQARLRVGGQAATGDLNGAMGEAYKAGDFAGAADIQGVIAAMSKQEKEAAALQVDNVGAFSYALSKVPPEQRAAWAQGNAGTYGLDPKVAADPAHLDDNSLQASIAKAVGLKDMLANDVAMQKEARAEAQPKYMTVQNGDGSSSIVALGGNAGATVGGNQPGNAFGGAGGQPAATHGGGDSGSRAQRNNNPGNLKWDGKSQWQGMVGVDPDGFVRFDGPDNGRRAAGINLANQAAMHGLNTLQGIITKYAPQDDNNDTAGYIAAVSQQTGLDPNAPLNLKDPAVRDKVLNAMFTVEDGGSPARPPAAPNTNAFGAGAPQSGNGQVVYTSRPGQKPSEARAEAREQRMIDQNDATVKREARKDETAFREKFEAEPDVKNYNSVATAYTTVKQLASQPPTAANDVALIFAYMKINDPTSVVREGEFATAQNAAGVPAQVANAYNKALKGTRLNPEQRQQFMHSAAVIHRSYRDRYEEYAKQQRGIADSYGYGPGAMSIRKNPDGAPPKKAPGVPVAGDQRVTKAQHKAFKAAFKPGAAYGSADNPYIVRDDADFGHLKVGEHYIGPDGVLYEKTK